MKSQIYRSWRRFVAAALLGGISGATAVVLFSAARDHTTSPSLAGQAISGTAAIALPLGRPFKIGVAYVPPDQRHDDRIYVEEGFEAQIAQDIGERLGAPIELVTIPSSQHSTALQEGRIDALITRLDAAAPLHRTARVVEAGYASGLSPVARSDRPLKGWQDLAGQVVCVTEANQHAHRTAASLGAKVRVLRAPAQALMLVRTGECDAALHDRAVLDFLFTKMAWQKFAATLPPMEPTSLVVAVPKDHTALSHELARVITEIAAQEHWQKRRERWASLVAFEVYRDQVAADCH